jgi:hypothetical protein
MNNIVMDDYDAGFIDAVKLLEKKLDSMIKEREGEKGIDILHEVKRKLFEE